MLKSLALKIPPIQRLWNDRLKLIEARDRILAESSEIITQRDKLAEINAQLSAENEALVAKVEEFTSRFGRSITFNGQSIVLHGRQGDPYYENIAFEPNDAFSQAVKCLSSDAVILDIGANIGATAVASSLIGAKVIYAFEPNPEAFLYLEKNIAANNAASVEPHNLAVGAKEGKLSFFADQNSSSAGHLVTGDTLGRHSMSEVKVTTIDKFSKNSNISRIDFIKIDVEGFEIDVLAGAKETISELKPSALVEFNPFTMIGFRDINPRDLLREIRSIYPYVYRFTPEPALITNDGEELGFIHDTLIYKGCVDDLYCSFSPIA